MVCQHDGHLAFVFMCITSVFLIFLKICKSVCVGGGRVFSSVF